MNIAMNENKREIQEEDVIAVSINADMFDDISFLPEIEDAQHHEEELDSNDMLKNIIKHYNIDEYTMNRALKKYEKKEQILSTFLNSPNSPEFINEAIIEKNTDGYMSIVNTIIDDIVEVSFKELTSYNKDEYSSYIAKKEINLQKRAVSIANETAHQRKNNLELRELSSMSAIDDIDYEVTEMKPLDYSKMMGSVYYQEKSFYHFLIFIDGLLSQEEHIHNKLGYIIKENGDVDSLSSFHANDLFLL